MKKLFTLISVAVVAFAAQANVLTVCDAGYEDAYYSAAVPIYGLWVDAEGTMAQSIYPADMLTDMVGSEITELKFTTTAYWYETYVGEGESEGQYGAFIAFENATIQLSLKVVDELGFESATAFEDLEVVATAVPVKGEDHMTFVLDEPFVYEGGNLLVECKVIEVGSYGTTYFLGASSEYTSSYYAYGYSSLSEYTTEFLPMATFTYEPSTIEPPIDDHSEGVWIVTYDMYGDEVWTQMLPSNNDYTCILRFSYGVYGTFPYDPSLSMAENDKNRPDERFYIVIDGVRYGAVEGDETACVLGTAMSNPIEVNDNHYVLENALGRVYNMGVAFNEYDLSQPMYVYAAVAAYTDVNEMNADKAVAGVRYFNMAGQEMQEANGMTIVVTTYTDGTTSAVKVIK